jgi:hypothetical protein
VLKGLIVNGYEFCCWLKGVVEMNADGLSAKQIERVSEKLEAVKSPEEIMKATGGQQGYAGTTPRC